jgi:hypothetical protein
MYIRDVGFLSFHTHGKSKDEFDQQSFLWLDPVGQMETRSERAIIQNPNHRRQGLKLVVQSLLAPKQAFPASLRAEADRPRLAPYHIPNAWIYYTMIGS